jgi:dTDP-4-dehydrorhamnose 3,5-epimerase
MEIITTKISDLLIVKPAVFEDNRGYFFESYNKEKFLGQGIDQNFVQDNESKSMKGVLRGLHFQAPPFAQGKLVRVMKGAVLDVAVDIRKKLTNLWPVGIHRAYRIEQNDVLGATWICTRLCYPGR